MIVGDILIDSGGTYFRVADVLREFTGRNTNPAKREEMVVATHSYTVTLEEVL